MMTDKSNVALYDLRILDAIDQDAHLSQRDLSERIGIALGRTNQVMKRLVRKGLIKTKRINAKRVSYYLTPQGFSEKLEMVMRYAEYTIGFFSSVRDVVNNCLCSLHREYGIKTVAIVGTGELAEAVYLSIQEQGMDLVAVYQNEYAPGTWFGMDVVPLSTPSTKVADVIVLANMNTGEVDRVQAEKLGSRVVSMRDLLAEHLKAFAGRIEDDA